jgi:hypothetical protein
VLRRRATPRATGGIRQLFTVVPDVDVTGVIEACQSKRLAFMMNAVSAGVYGPSRPSD